MGSLLWLSGFSLVVGCQLSCPVACRILVPQPGIEPTCPALEGEFLATGLAREVPAACFKLCFFWSLEAGVSGKAQVRISNPCSLEGSRSLDLQG